MKIYIVILQNADGFQIVKPFSTKEKANLYVEQSAINYDQTEIIETWLD